MGRTYAGILGPLAFITVLARAVFAGGGAESTLWLASICLFAFAALGFVAGNIADSIVVEAVQKRFDQEMKSREQAGTEAS